ncbi:MAG: xanthine dehydrogenase family protein subunit M [Clostridiales Family XIII bacterium]|jgi:CO/xanthine dehydrogenase FAD-binding subunit|nr:xanthine dehydrogenase family protein subunit M [Clostridiales Family XIII bacterium]
MSGVSVHTPGSLAELLNLLANLPNVSIVAGGSDLVPRMTRNKNNTGMAFPGFGREGLPEKNIVYIGSAGLNDIRESDGNIIIGAAVTITELLESALVRAKSPLLVEALSEMAGLTIRNTATLGGNISNASPAGDSLPALYVLGASVVTASVNGSRNHRIDDYISGPGKTARNADEVLKEIIVPIQKQKGAFIKMGRRKTETLSIINAAVLIDVQDDVITNNELGSVRIAIGAAGPTVIRCLAAEDFLCGKEPTEENFEIAGTYAAEAVSPIDDVRSTAWYRKRMASVITKRALAKALQSAE